MPRPKHPLHHYLYLLDEEWDGEPLDFFQFIALVAEISYMVDHPGECVLCGDVKDYYIVTNDLWEKYGARHHYHICIGCLEARMGRTLTPEDFPECPLNKGSLVPLSARHKNRMGEE
jgi:hypothetical protein